MSDLRLGALSFSPVMPGMSPSEAIWNTIELAPQLEQWGYGRLWLGEHHSALISHSCPQILLPIIAGMTSRLRVGTAGVLLQLHRPLRIAKEFRLLHALFPGRIDLGMARGGVVQSQSDRLRDGSDGHQDYEERVLELLAYLRDTTETTVNPVNVWPPELWMLGSSMRSAELAARNGTALCMAAFLSESLESLHAALDLYRKRFIPSPDVVAPAVSIAIAGVCAGTDEEASELVATGGPIAVRTSLMGSPKTCADKLRVLSARMGVDEFIFLDLSKTAQGSRDSFRYLAQAVLD